MKRLIPVFALLFAIGASAYFIYLAQSSVTRNEMAKVTLGDQPASLASGAPNSAVSEAPATKAAPASAEAAPSQAPATKKPRPVFQSGSKAFAPSDGMIFQGGSKAAMIGDSADFVPGVRGKGPRGSGVGRIQGMGSIDPKGAPASKAPASKAPASEAPASAPRPAPNAPPSFMGGSKFDPGSLPLPKRP